MFILDLHLILSRFAFIHARREGLMAKKLYVGNLNFNLTDRELEEAFSGFGEIVSASVVRDRYDNRSKGFGFVEFAQEADAQKAREEMDGKEVNGRTLRVDEAKDRGRSGRSSRSGDYNSPRRNRY